MEAVNEGMKLRQYVNEFLKPVRKETISMKKSRTAALVKLLVIVPCIYLVTLSVLLSMHKTAYNQDASNVILYTWIPMFVLYIATNLGILRIKSPSLIRAFTYFSIILELVTNQLCLYAIGSLTSHIVIFLVVCVCLYRTFFDYYISLFCAVLSSLLFAGTVFLELNKFVPISPYFSAPLKHEVYSNPILAYSVAFAIIISIFITFFATNFSINQISKLNDYVMDNWKSDLQCLHDFSQSITLCSDMADVLNSTYKTIIQTTPFDMAAYMRLDKGYRLQLESSFGWTHEWIEAYKKNPVVLEKAMVSDIIGNRTAQLNCVIGDYRELFHSLLTNEIQLNTIYAFPIIEDNRVEGLVLALSKNKFTLSEHKMQLLVDITHQAAIAVHNLKNLSIEIKKASTDGLTGVYNRRSFDEQLSAAVKEASNHGGEIAVIMMDIDKFKTYNDTFGHPEGDMVLKKVAETISKAVRGEDIVARYGGEEFVAILKNTERRTALMIAERIRTSVEGIPLGVLKRKVTVSLGVGLYPEDAYDEKTLLNHADKSLYYAKQTGRNKVCDDWTEEFETEKISQG